MEDEDIQTNKPRLEVVASAADDDTCKTFVLHSEDHTLGNSLRYVIMKNPEVEFSGYSVPHPSEDKINLRVQTKGESAVDIFRKGLNDLSSLCDHVNTTLKKSVDHYKKKRGSRNESMDTS